MKLLLEVDEMRDYNNIRNKTIEELFPRSGSNEVSLLLEQEVSNSLFEHALEIILRKCFSGIFLDEHSDPDQLFTTYDLMILNGGLKVVSDNLLEDDYKILKQAFDQIKK